MNERERGGVEGEREKETLSERERESKTLKNKENRPDQRSAR